MKAFYQPVTHPNYIPNHHYGEEEYPQRRFIVQVNFRRTFTEATHTSCPPIKNQISKHLLVFFESKASRQNFDTLNEECNDDGVAKQKYPKIFSKRPIENTPIHLLVIRSLNPHGTSFCAYKSEHNYWCPLSKYEILPIGKKYLTFSALFRLYVKDVIIMSASFLTKVDTIPLHSPFSLLPPHFPSSRWYKL